MGSCERILRARRSSSGTAAKASASGAAQRHFVRDAGGVQLAGPASRLPAVGDGVDGASALEHERYPRSRPRGARARSGPTVGIIDSTFVESSYGGAGNAPNGYKRATGANLHVIIEKHSRVLGAIVLPANLQDAFGARELLPRIKRIFPSITTVLGDGAYRQEPLREFAAGLGIHINADSPPLPKGKIFVPQPLRWRVERFFSWLFKWRRVAKNWCYSIWGFATDVSWAIFGLTLKRSV